VSRKRYSLSDIENLLTYLPLAFILFFALLAGGVALITLSAREENEIRLLAQRQTLEKNFERQYALEAFIGQTKEAIDAHFHAKEQELKAYVDTMQGVISALKTPDTMLGITELLPFFETAEAQHNISIAVLDSETLLPNYGLEEIRTIQELIFNNYTNPLSTQLTIQYILSQGKQSTMTWKNEPEQTLWLSHFQATPYNDWHLGAFSSVNNLATLTQATLEQLIRSNKNPYAFWLYDYEKERFFDATHNWVSIESLGEFSPLTAVRDLFKSRSWQTQKQHPFVYDFNRFRLAVGVYEPAKPAIQSDAIAKRFDNERFVWIVLISVITAVLLGASLMFSGFIKHIFASYNRRFERRNRLLQALKERFELAVIASNDGLWDTNFKTGKTFFSPTWLKMLGYAKEDVRTYAQWQTLIHPDDKSRVFKIMQEHMEEKREHFVCEYRLRTKLGRYRWVLARGKLFKDENGVAERLLMMTMAIVERKRMEKALEDTQKLTEGGHIVLLRWVNDPSWMLSFVSKSIKRFGYTPDDLLQGALMYKDIVHKDDQHSVHGAIQNAIDNGKASVSLTYRILTKTQEVRWVFSHAIFLRDDFEKVTDLYGYIYDITAIKASEQELALRVKKEVDKNRENEKLLIQQSKLAAMGEMLGAIAHQWRQPLNHISLLLHFVRDMFIAGKLDEQTMRHYTDEAKSQIAYMSQTIDDFRNFYQPSKDKAPFYICDVLQGAVSIVAHQFSHYAITLELNGESCQVIGYENELKQVVLNILTNAKDAILQRRQEVGQYQGHIALTCKADVSHVYVRICNNGGAIDPAIIDRIFEPYFTTKFETQGTGIGLYMSKTIIEENMDGRIDVTNQDTGACFTITLPL
jgi:PAS domain S-box-containing protein